ncbi:AAA family ATPase [Mycobacterium sp. NPDC004974]
MRFERVIGSAFGALRGQQLDLDPAMTVIHGPNEAGKSTWFAALYAGLVGRKSQRGRQSGPQRDFRRRHKPWAGSAWRVELALALDSGRRLHLKQNLVDCSVTVTDAATGENFSIEALEREFGSALESDGSFDGSCILGLDRDAVRSTLFVGQADVLAVLHKASELQSHLQRAAASSRVDTTAEEALQRVGDLRSSRVGSPHVGNRPLRALTAAAKEAGADADSALDIQHRLLTEQAALKRKVTTAGQAGLRLVELEAIAEWVEIDQLAGRAAKARELTKKLAEAQKLGAPAEEASTRRVAGTVERYTNRGEPPAKPTGRTAAELQADIDSLPALPAGPREPEPDIVQLESDLNAARSALETLRSEPVQDLPNIAFDASSDELRSIAERLEDEAPRLREDVDSQIASLRADLTNQRTQHNERIAAYESSAVEYRAAQDRYSEQFSVYKQARERFNADEAEYSRQVEEYNAARSRRDEARAEHERAKEQARHTQESAVRLRSFAYAGLGIGGLLAIGAVAVGIIGLVPVAVVLGVVSAVLLAAGSVAITRRSAGDTVPEYREAPLPEVRDRPTSPLPPLPPAPLDLAHPGDTPGPSPEHVQLERERDGWKAQYRAHAERAASARARAQELGLSPVPAELRALARSIDDNADAKRRHMQHTQRVEGAGKLLRTSAEALLQRLSQAISAPSDEDLIVQAANGMRDYRGACKVRDEQAKKAERMPDLLVALEQRNQRDAEYASAVRAYERICANLVETAVALGYDAPSEDHALEVLDDWLGDQRALADAHANANLDVGKLEQLLAGATFEALEAQAEARRLVARPRPVHIDASQLVRLDEARHAKAAADGDVQESRRAITDLLEASKPVAAAVEREMRASEDLENVKRLDRYLSLAERHLQVAKERAHADIAPALADTMRPWVSRVTAGRYRDITVDPEELKLFAFDSSGRKWEGDILSHGTTEQLFLLLRIALASHLSTAEESVPLVLDDVTVQADPERTRAILELLHELSADHQIVLFSQEPEVVQWANENLPPNAVVALR